MWDRATGQAVHRAIVWQDRRTAEVCASRRPKGTSPTISAKTGLIIDPCFSGTQGGLDSRSLRPAPGTRRARRELLSGTVECYLLWRLAGRRVRAPTPPTRRAP